MIETIYIARHGFRLSWETSNWNSPTKTPRDPPLAAYGVDQAKELALWFNELKEEEGRVDAIWSSPLYRCLQTATPAAELLGLPIRVEHGLGEWYLPVKRGLHPRSLESEALKEWFNLISNDDSYLGQEGKSVVKGKGKGKGKESLLYPTQKGESIESIHLRSEEILRLLLPIWDSTSSSTSSSSSSVKPIKTVLLFTHAATNIALGRALVGDRNKDIRSGTCSIGKYVRIKGREQERNGLGVWEMELNGECSFLKKGEERHWEFSYVEEYEEDGILPDATEEVPLPSEFYTSIPLSSSSTTISTTSTSGKEKGKVVGNGKL